MRVRMKDIATDLGVSVITVSKALRNGSDISGETGSDYCNPNGTIHGAWPAALLDSCMGSAVHSTLAAGVTFTIVEVKINFVRPIYVDTGAVIAEGNIVRVGRQIGLAEGVMRDSSGEVLATGSTTCLISQSTKR